MYKIRFVARKELNPFSAETLGILGYLRKFDVVFGNGMKQKIPKPCGKMQGLKVTECGEQIYLSSAIISPMFM